jgi:hypothetical protein
MTGMNDGVTALACAQFPAETVSAMIATENRKNADRRDDVRFYDDQRDTLASGVSLIQYNGCVSL